MGWTRRDERPCVPQKTADLGVYLRNRRNQRNRADFRLGSSERSTVPELPISGKQTTTISVAL